MWGVSLLTLGAITFHLLLFRTLNLPPSPFRPNQQQSYLQTNFLWRQLEVSWRRQLLVKSKVERPAPELTDNHLLHTLCIQGLVILCPLQLLPHFCWISYWPSWPWLKFFAQKKKKKKSLSMFLAWISLVCSEIVREDISSSYRSGAELEVIMPVWKNIPWHEVPLPWIILIRYKKKKEKKQKQKQQYSYSRRFCPRD